MKKICYIMRGIPGAGKSFTAKTLASKENIFSTDEYWGPNYDFDIANIGQAHRWNQQRVAEAMQKGITPIVVDNTNTTWKEIDPYAVAAVRLGYEIIFQESISDWWRNIEYYLQQRNVKPDQVVGWDLKRCVSELCHYGVHNVPKFVIEKMLGRWQLTEEIQKRYEMLLMERSNAV